MQRKITMETLAGFMEKLIQKVDNLDTRMGNLEARVDALEAKTSEGFRMVKERIDRVEFGIYSLHKEIGSFDQEMRGIHRVLDSLDGRLTRTEEHLGLAPENP